MELVIGRLGRLFHRRAVEYNVLEHVLHHPLIGQDTGLHTGAVFHADISAVTQGIADDLHRVLVLLNGGIG